MRAYRAEVSMLSEKYLGKPLKEIDLAAMIADLVKGAQKYGIEVPSDFLLVGKALMTIEGVGKEIYPDLDVYSECKPYFIELLKKRYSPERIGNDLLRGLGQVSSSAYDLPQLAREVLEDLRLGRLTIASADPQLPVAFDRLGRRLFSGFVVVSFVVSGAWLLGHGKDTPGVVLLSFGVLVMLVHVSVDLVRRWK
jgi:ubiquinone biosynthesis protein